MTHSLSEICAQLNTIGHRRLLVLSGETQWIDDKLNDIRSSILGDWITISPSISQGLAGSQAHTLLGQEFLHAIFDAREGLHCEALAILAGTLKAGSLLILCTPPQNQWATTPDNDSLRWNEQGGMIATPNFVHHLQRTINLQPEVLIWQQGDEPHFCLLQDDSPWQPPSGQATPAQQHALEQLLSADLGVWGVIASRGRGKSTLAGMLIRGWQGECWCCAPSRAATQTLEQYAGNSLVFWSPDELLHYCNSGGEISADWLVIDEAAAIPSYILRQLIEYFPRVLLTTTVDGYEGTGRGFINKFCAQLKNFTALELNEPIRWAMNDPLESWINQALLLEEPQSREKRSLLWQIGSVTQQQLISQPRQLQRFYGLLTSAHYRTSPLDLRRLLDASRQQFKIAKSDTDLIGALWMVEEGGLESELSWQIWAGIRRPRGNLVVQSLAAHSYFPEAAEMFSQRVMRIAVEASYRRQKIGLQLLEQQRLTAINQGADFLSVSFGLTPELLCFWQCAGYQLIRIGSHLEASSGCYTAMAILPLSLSAKALCDKATNYLSRDIFWRNDLDAFNLTVSEQQQLMEADWLELVGFAYYHRPLAASCAAIQRLLLEYKESLPLLSLHFHANYSINEICQQWGLMGQKAWLKQARAEVRDVILHQRPELVMIVAIP